VSGVRLALVFALGALLASPARAQDAGAGSADGGRQKDALHPSVVASPSPVAAEPAPTPVAAEPDDGPGDEEAKADFQHSRSLPDQAPHLLLGHSLEASAYGFGRLSGFHDSTQSFDVVSVNRELAPPGSYRALHGRSKLTLMESRLGLRMGTPRDRAYRGLVLAELAPFAKDEAVSLARVRHLYASLSTPYIHVLVGRYYDLFGWGGRGFLPNTAAFEAPPGQLYRDRGQLRVSLLLRWRPVDLEIAIAGVSPLQSSSSSAEGQFGVRLTANGWRGASAQGGGPAEAAPLQIGLSTVGRAFSVPTFMATPQGAQIAARAHGVALDLFLPIIPARGSSLANALSLTAEVTKGTGICDLYPALTGGVRFPALPNPANVQPAPVYPQATPNGVGSFDVESNFRTVDWSTVVFGLQYHLPFARGRRVWLSTVYTSLHADNARSLTPFTVWAGVWSSSSYYDVNAFVALTRALQVDLSTQVTRQTFLFGGQTSNRRAQIDVSYFF